MYFINLVNFKNMLCVLNYSVEKIYFCSQLYIDKNKILVVIYC